MVDHDAPVVPNSCGVSVVSSNAVVVQLTGWQKVSAGDGVHALAVGPVAAHVYACDPTLLVPPPIEKPDAHTGVTTAVVVPTSDVVPLVLLSAVVGQLNARHRVAVGLGSHTLAASPLAVHVYVCERVVLAPPPIEYPLAHVMATAADVVPTSDDVPSVNVSAVLVQLTAAQLLGAGDQTLVAGPVPAQVYV